MKLNINKFSFGQLTSNSDGKTSGSGTAGLFIVAIGGLCFIFGCIIKYMNNSVDLVTPSSFIIGIGASLLGYRKSKDSQVTASLDNSTESLENTEETIENQDETCKSCSNPDCKCNSLNS
jgi:hypothetical protein